MTMHVFDKSSAARIAFAVRWVEDFVESEAGDNTYIDGDEKNNFGGNTINNPGDDPNDPTPPPIDPTDPNDPTDPSDPPPDPEDPENPPLDPGTGSSSAFAAYVTFDSWKAGSAKNFTVGSGESAKSVYAMNPFSQADGPGVIVNCGSVWVLVAANCKAEDDDSSGAS